MQPRKCRGPRRSTRLDETVAFWRQLWTTDGPSSFHGSTIALAEIPSGAPAFTDVGPPVWLAADTPEARRRAGAHYDGWLPYPPVPSTYAANLAEVHTAVQQARRPLDAVTPGLFVNVPIADAVDRGRAELDRFATATYGFPLESVEAIQAFACGSAENVAATLQGYVDAGAQHLTMRPAVNTVEQVSRSARQSDRRETDAAMTRPAPDRKRTLAGLLREYEAFADLLSALDLSMWQASTRCANWQVRDVAAHVVGQALDVTTGASGSRSPDEQAAALRTHSRAWHAAALRRTKSNLAALAAPVDDARWAGPSPLPHFTLGQGMHALQHDAYMHGDDIRHATSQPILAKAYTPASISC